MIIFQADDWNISTLDASRSLSANTFVRNSPNMSHNLLLDLTDIQMQGFGSLVAVPFAQRYGTYVVPNLVTALSSS